MTHDDMFTPDGIDEQVDRLLPGGADETSLPRTQALVRRLRALYEEDRNSSERVWARLVEQVSKRELWAVDDGSHRSETPIRRVLARMTSRGAGTMVPKRMSTLAAAVAALIVVALISILL